MEGPVGVDDVRDRGRNIYIRCQIRKMYKDVLKNDPFPSKMGEVLKAVFT